MQSNLIDTNQNIDQQQTGASNNQVDKWTNNLSKITKLSPSLEEPLDSQFHEIKSQTSNPDPLLGLSKTNDSSTSNNQSDDSNTNATHIEMHANNNVEPLNTSKPPMDKQIQPKTSADNENNNNLKDQSNSNKSRTRKKSRASSRSATHAPRTNNTTNANDNSFNCNKKNYIIELPIKSVKHSTETNNLLILIKLIIKIFINFVLIFPMLAILGLVLPIKHFFRLLFKVLHVCHIASTSQHSPHALPKFLSATELFWLYNSNLEHKTTVAAAKNKTQITLNKSIGACLFFIEGYIAKNTIRDLIKNKIIQLSSRSGQRMYERFSQRLYKIFAYGYVWLNCSDFDIEEHIIEVDGDTNKLKTNEDLQSYISKLMQTYSFKISKPLWSIFYVKSFGDERSTVIIFLFHMCFADGISLIRLFFKGIVDNRNAIEVKPRFAFFTLKFDFFKLFLMGWSDILYYLFIKRSDKNPVHHEYFKSSSYANLNLNSKKSASTPANNLDHAGAQANTDSTASLSKKMCVTWSEPFSLVTLNRLKLVTRTKMNDLLVSVLAGIMRSYLQEKGINNPSNMHCLMPIDLTSNKFPFNLKNQSTLCSLSMPANTEGCVPRLWSIKTHTADLKHSTNYLFILFYKYVLFNLLPNSMAFRLVRNLVNKNTFVASTLGAGDASLATVSLCNRNVKNIIYFYPTVCDISTSYSIMTYGDEVRLSLITDTDVITNPKFIIKEFNKQVNFFVYFKLCSFC